MKRHYKTAAIALVCALFAISVRAGECERLEIYALPFSGIQLDEDLMSGEWTTDLIGFGSTMHFRENGLLEVIKRGARSEEFELYQWTTDVDDSHLILTIADEFGKSESYELHPTCDGFAIKRCFEKSKRMTKGELHPMSHLARVKERIMGTWTGKSKSRKDRLKKLRWEFHDDGTFRVLNGPDYHYSGYSGIWDLSAGGDYLVLHFSHLSEPEEIYASKLIKLHSIDYEDLVLSGQTMADLTGSVENDDKLHFEKLYN